MYDYERDNFRDSCLETVKDDDRLYDVDDWLLEFDYELYYNLLDSVEVENVNDTFRENMIEEHNLYFVKGNDIMKIVFKDKESKEKYFEATENFRKSLKYALGHYFN